MKRKHLFIYPLLLLIALLIFSITRLQGENREFDNISFFLDNYQYLASYLDEEVLISLIFIESNNRVVNHQLEGQPLIIIAEDGRTFTPIDYIIEVLKEATLFSPYAIFEINIALELDVEEQQQIVFNQMKMGGYIYDIGDVLIEKIPPLGELQLGVGATTFLSRVNQLELSIMNDEREEATVKGVFI